MTIEEIRNSAVRKSRFSFDSNKAKNIGDKMIKHYIDLSKKTNPLF